MNHIPQTIHEILAAWGHAQSQLPPRNKTLKSEILAKLSCPAQEVRSLPYRLPWFSLALAGLALITFFVMPFKTGQIVLPPGPAPLIEERSAKETVTDILPRKVAPEYYPRSPEVPITDTREFLKTDYHAAIRTRRVEELARRTQTIIRGFGGRVDGAASSPEWGYVNFAIPADRFDGFRNELKSLVYARFFVEEVSAENLLPQKQSIEAEQRQTETTLNQLRADREKLVASHRRTVSSIQSQLNAVLGELATLRTERTDDPIRKVQIAAREEELLNGNKALEARLANENAKYAKELNALDVQIRTAETDLEGLSEQDRQLLDTVVTVRGTISLNWISVWEAVGLYVSPYWVSLALIIAAIIAYVLHRRRSQFITL